MKFLEGRSIDVTSQSDSWKCLHTMVCRSYSWDIFCLKVVFAVEQKLFKVKIITAAATILLVWLSSDSFAAFWDICVQGFNFRRYRIGAICDRFYYV